MYLYFTVLSHPLFPPLLSLLVPSFILVGVSVWTHHSRGAGEDERGDGVEVSKLPHDLQLLAADVLHLGLEGRLPRVQLQDLRRRPNV